MSYLVGNPEDRFSHNEARMFMIYPVSVSRILRLQLVSVAKQAVLCHAWSETLKTHFVEKRLILKTQV